MRINKLECSFGGTRFLMFYERKSGFYKFDYCCKIPCSTLASSDDFREKDGGHDEILKPLNGSRQESTVEQIDRDMV